MRAYLPEKALAALFAAAALGTFSPGCSLGLEAPALQEEGTAPPPLLEFETPLAELVYGAADDERPDLPGLDLVVRVRVNDLENGIWLDDLSLGARVKGAAEPLSSAPVHEDWRGFRCAEIPIVVFPGEEPQRVTLVASAGEGLGSVEQDIVIGASD